MDSWILGLRQIIALLGIAIVVGIAATIAIHRFQQFLRVRRANTPPTEFPAPLTAEELGRHVQAWRALVKDGPFAAWVMFSYGTVVLIPPGLAEDVNAFAREVLARHGRVVPGTPSADMLSYSPPDQSGWVIGGHHGGIFNFVPHEWFGREASNSAETTAAFAGRANRVLDAFSLNVVHTELLGSNRADA